VLDNTSLSVRSIEKHIAKLFIICFPFKMFAPLYFLNGVTFGLGDSASFIFCVLGLLLIAFRRKIIFAKDEGGKLLGQFATMYIILDLTSFFMALVLYREAGVIAGETTVIAVSKKILFTLSYILFVFYGREIGNILTKSEINKTLDICLNVCLIVGLIQVLMLNNISIAGKVYDTINSLFNAWSSSNAMRTKRIALLANEPAYSAGFITTIIIPFLLSRMFESGTHFKGLLRIFLFIVILYYTKSTTGYLILFIVLGFFAILYYSKGRKTSVNSLLFGVILGVCMLGVTVIILGDNLISKNVFNVMDKLFSYDNPNSADRKGMIAVGLSLFLRFPLFGVGDGNQGFYYQELLPDWAKNSYTGYSAYNHASDVLYDGGPFWIAFISGYGLLGLLLLFLFFKKSFRIIHRNRESFGYLYYFYYLSITALFVNGIGATLGSKYYFWFVLSIPMMVSFLKRDENVLTIANMES